MSVPLEPALTAPTLDSFLRLFETTYAAAKNTSRSIDPADEFTDLGLDSLAALEVLVTLEEHYGVVLVGDPAIVDAVTVRDLHEAVVERLNVLSH
jgi:acyl carrier protein